MYFDVNRNDNDSLLNVIVFVVPSASLVTTPVFDPPLPAVRALIVFMVPVTLPVALFVPNSM